MDVRGVARDEAAALAVGGGQAHADAVDGGPAQVREARPVRQQIVGHRLEIREGGSSEFGLDAVLRAGGRNEGGRGEHRDAVAARLRQRDGDEHVGRPALDQPQGAHGHAVGHVPADPHVAQHEGPRVGRAVEGDAEQAPHRAVRPIAADHVAETVFLGRPVFAFDADRDPVRILAQRRQGRTPLDPDAVAVEVPGEDALGLVLRQAQRGERQVQRRVGRVRRWSSLDDGAQARQPEPGIDHLAGDAHVVPDLQRPGRDADGPAIGQRPRRAVDDPAACAVPGQLTGERQADRSGSDHEDIRHRFLPK